jgi:hypothetical protein
MIWLSRWLGRKPESSPPPSLPSAPAIPADWASSPPHLAVLQRFLSFRDARTGVPEHWVPMFGTDPRNVVEALLELHLLEPASLAETIEFCHTGVELKRLIKERGLKVSGKKAEQSQRLIEADPEGMRRLAAEHRIVRCSPGANEAVQSWLDHQAQALETATDELIVALRNREFKAAIHIADAWREKRFQVPVHPAQEAMTIPAQPRSLEGRVKEVAEIFTLRPKILKGLDAEQWEGLHLDYSVWQLLGQSADEKCMPGFTGLGAMDAATVLRMLGFYANHQREIAQWRPLGVKTARIACCHSGSCNACEALDGKTYALAKLPELPYEACTCGLGCRCFYSPDLGF